MNLDQITTKCWILALIIRDDGERLLLGDGWFDFKDSLQHFQPNSIANDIVELQGTDGQLLAGQVRRSASQSFDGYIGDALTSKTEIESRRRQFLQFFRTRRHYKVIYIFPDGTAIQRRMGYLTDAPSVPEMRQKFPEYHVALNFEDVNYYEYAEDAQGDEIYAHESLIKLISVQSGGLVWDEIGAVSHGYTWLDPQTVTGDYITVTDGAIGSPLTLSQLDGNATQSGTPTPDAPLPISTVTGENKVKVFPDQKNLADPQDFIGWVNRTYALCVQYNWQDDANRPAYGEFQGRNHVVRYNATTLYSVRNQMTNPTYNEARKFFINYGQFRANTRYTISMDLYSTGNAGQGNMQILYTDGSTTNLSNGTANTWTHTVTISVANKTIEAIQINYQSGQSFIDLDTLQIEEGTATTYEPYQGQEFPIDLGSTELAKIGDYQDRIYKDGSKWYVEKQVGKVVLDGSESWGLSGNTANNQYYLDGVVGFPEEYKPDGKVMSDYFSVVAQDTAYSTKDLVGIGGWVGAGRQIRISFDANIVDRNLADFKSWLSTHPTTVYYALATPTTTEITDETLLDQLNFVADMYEGINNISFIGTGAQGTMTLNYYADVDTTGAGYEWEAGEGGGPTIVQVIGVDNAQPIWTVTGPATNPTLTNITTVQTITWNGSVPNGQKLIIDMANQTATLAGANVYEFITGSWITLRPGANKLTYSAQGADQASQIQWNGVVG